MTARPADRRGFALPVVILLIAILTILLTSGLARARAERQLADASDEIDQALAVAQSGLQTYFGTVTVRPSDGDSTRVNVPGGYANVITHRVRTPADTTQRTLYLVRSTGFVIDPATGPSPRALRTVAQFAEWEVGIILRRAALTAPNGMRHMSSGGSNKPRLEVSGIDQCGFEAPIPGIRTPQMVWGSANPDTSLTGAPGLLEASDAPTVAAGTLIDWVGALGGDLVPDYATFQAGSASYPIQRIMGDLTISGGSGSGLLVVSGNLTISGPSFTFNGIVLVGGKIGFEADFQRINGLVVSGLNTQLGMSPPFTESGNVPPQNRRDTYLYFDSCRIDSALAALSGLAPVRNAWLDTWATY